MNLRDQLINRMIRYPGAFAMRFRLMRLRLLGATIGRRCWIRRVHIPRNPWDIELADNVALDDRVVLLTTGVRTCWPKLAIGRGTYVNRFTMFDASRRIEIGSECLIGPFCYITDHDHGFSGEEPVSAQALVEAPVTVGNNVWIGAHAIILKGVTIGDNAIIGAGAVVTKSVGPGERVVGVPARLINAGRPVEEAIQSEPSAICISGGKRDHAG
jgi:acetyltransferase-like isoleucine patch superfamily enzyme